MKCKEEAYSPRRLTIRDMQCKCNAMPCHVALPHPIQPILEQAVGIETRKKKQKEQEQHTACMARRNDASFIHPIRDKRQPKPKPKPTVTSCQREKNKAQTTKSCASFQKSVPVIPLVRRENNQHK
jgi:hypothetical protein